MTSFIIWQTSHWTKECSCPCGPAFKGVLPPGSGAISQPPANYRAFGTSLVRTAESGGEEGRELLFYVPAQQSGILPSSWPQG